MGTYTTNYNLFMPSIGEQGWGDLVNGNFSTIDTTMKGLSNDIGMLDTEINAVEARVTVLETGEFETVNVAGTITADEFVGGVGNFSSLVLDNGLAYDSIKPLTLSYKGFSTIYTGVGLTTLISSPIPMSGVISVLSVGGYIATRELVIMGADGVVRTGITGTQTEYTVTNAYSIGVYHMGSNQGSPINPVTVTYGTFKFTN